MSAIASCTIWELFSPRRSSVVLGFSTKCGSFFARARLERAFLGTLGGLLEISSVERKGIFTFAVTLWSGGWLY
jgi:hypothetical protein